LRLLGLLVDELHEALVDTPRKRRACLRDGHDPLTARTGALLCQRCKRWIN